MTVLVNQGRRPGLWARLTELWRYRELVRNLVLRDLKARYKNSVLGFVWSLLNPLLMMLVFTVVFTVMLPTNIERFPVFILCGILPWNWFSGSVGGAIHTIVGNATLIKKVYFPREALPLSLILSNAVNFLLALTVLFPLMLAFHTPLTPWLLFLPVLILVQAVFTLGVALILSTVNVFFRDTAVIMEVVLQAWFFLTPVVYDMKVLPEHKLIAGYDIEVRRLAYILNPMGSLIANYRDILYWGLPPGLDFLLRTALTSLLVLLLGYLLFSHFAPQFGEEV